MSNPSTSSRCLGTLVPWLSLAGIIWLRVVSTSRLNFPAYSSQLMQHFSTSQVQLNNLIVALDIGKLLGWFPSYITKHAPLWFIMLIGVILGLFGYGVQYLHFVKKIASLSYWQVFALNVIAGNSMCWINTVSQQLVMRIFSKHPATVIALTSSYSGLSGKIYMSMVKAIRGNASSDATAYLLLSCLLPVGVALVVSPLFIDQRPPAPAKTNEARLLVTLFIIATATGAYALSESVAPAFQHVSPRMRMMILVATVTLPLVVPLVLLVIRWISLVKLHSKESRVTPEVSISNLNTEGVAGEDHLGISIRGDEEVNEGEEEKKGMELKFKIGDEHGVKDLMLSVDFWLHFGVNACGSTLCMLYLNNLGRISESLGYSEASFLLNISAAFGFFGRLFTVMLDWLTRERHMLPRSAWMVLLTIPMAVAFLLLLNHSKIYFYISTGILSACSGATTAITGSITSELFGSLNVHINHNIVLASIPLGSLLFGNLAALNYDREGGGRYGVCMGTKCHYKTFIIWGSICSFGTLLSLILHLRTRKYLLQRSQHASQ